MARLGNRLTAAFVGKTTKPGMYADGHGLYLQIGPTGGKHWVFRYRRRGAKANTDMGLGPTHTVSLAQARGKALACRQQRLAGLDPLMEKRRTQIPEPETITFEAAARRYILAKQPEWKGGKSAAQWSASLSTYAFPTLGRLPVQMVDVGAVMRALDPIWLTRTETASRVRQRIESVLDWATARGYRQGENPARWRGHLENLLPRPSKIRSTEHHAALPADEIPAFLEALRRRQAVSARAIEFLLLTATRTGEVINAKWDEVNLAERVLVIPAERMKGGREHRVPLSPRALAVLEYMAEIRHNDFVFPGHGGGPLKESAMRMLLQYMGYGELTTVHGFRSSFSTWARERTSFPGEIVESCLAHIVGNETERAYRRGDFFNKRQRLMEAWGVFCTTPAAQIGEVIKLGAA
jgi:integrase